MHFFVSMLYIFDVSIPAFISLHVLMFFVCFIVSWWLQYVFIQRNETCLFRRCNSTSFKVIPGCLSFYKLYFFLFRSISYHRYHTFHRKNIFKFSVSIWYTLYLFIFLVLIVSLLFFLCIAFSFLSPACWCLVKRILVCSFLFFVYSFFPYWLFLHATCSFSCHLFLWNFSKYVWKHF